jgi:chemotaxis family two-component system sensor histidine kinase/response regulator PixL
MAINPDIRDQAYQFFVEEAPELLEMLELELLTLAQQRNIHKIHNLMRAAHSIKGGAASVGLDAIATLAHRLENIFKVLYGQTLEIDTNLENELLKAYDCLKLPLLEQITTGFSDPDVALANADPIFSQIEARCGEALNLNESYLPNSVELGFDMVSSIFEVDVAQGLDRLATIVANPQNHEVAGELRAQAEVFAGFAELLNLPEFGAIAETVQHALKAHPNRKLEIAQLALTDFERSRQAILTGDRIQSPGPSPSLIALANSAAINPPVLPTSSVQEFAIPSEGVATDWCDFSIDTIPEPTLQSEAQSEDLETGIPLFENMFGNVHSLVEAVDYSSVANTAIAANFEPYPYDDLTIEPSNIQTLHPLSQNPTVIQSPEGQAADLTVRVDSNRLERMNNLVGELTINRDGLSLQNEQLQGSLKELLHRFARFQKRVGHLQELSDQMLIDPERYRYYTDTTSTQIQASEAGTFFTLSSPKMDYSTEFDSLEMDSYGVLHSELQEILEDMMQLEEAVDDIKLFAKQSNQMLEQEQRMLSHLREEVRYARMLPLSEILNRFPRILRDLSTTYHKPVGLKMTGVGMLVEKALLEKLYDPLLHLLRNAFDHGIEPPDVRRQRGKPEQGQIEIRAYHQANRTVIEIEDDGQGLNIERITKQALELGWLSADQLAEASLNQLGELIFEPGFSTAPQVSKLSGRGVGLDVVRSQLHSINGKVTVTSSPGQGTTFTLSVPMTLTVAKLIVCLIDSTVLALPTDSIEEILIPQVGQTKQSESQRFLNWREQTIPIYRLANFIKYAYPLPETSPSKLLKTIPVPKSWALPVLILRWERKFFALEVDRLVTEQELVIKPFSTTLAPPAYIYGCTILGDGSLIPVIDSTALLSLDQAQDAVVITPTDHPPTLFTPDQMPTILIVDDSATIRRTLTLSLNRGGFRVIQARDGREGIEQLQETASVQLIICDIEMPNMNGFEFLGYCRHHPHLSRIPIVILTSRSSDKHRRLAMQLGATAYFTKPYLEQELLVTLKNTLHCVE